LYLSLQSRYSFCASLALFNYRRPLMRLFRRMLSKVDRVIVIDCTSVSWIECVLFESILILLFIICQASIQCLLLRGSDLSVEHFLVLFVNYLCNLLNIDLLNLLISCLLFGLQSLFRSLFYLCVSTLNKLHH